MVDVEPLAVAELGAPAGTEFFGADGHDPTHPDPDAQLTDRQLPEMFGGLQVEIGGGPPGVDPGEEQEFRPVHVADPGQDRLVEQGGPDGDPASGEGGDELGEVVAPPGPQRIGAEPGDDLVHPGRVDEGTRHRSGEIRLGSLVGQDQPCPGGGRRGGDLIGGELPHQTEMDMEMGCAVPPVEQMFAVGGHPGEGAVVEQRGPLGEASLG